MGSREAALLLVVALGTAAGCADTEAPVGGSSPARPSSGTPVTPPRTTAPPETTPPSARPTTPMPRKGPVSLSIPAIGVRGLRVIGYAGTPDDRPGDRIQDTGRAASPRGPRGGVGPGEIGNYIVTAHRTEAGRPFGRLPSVRTGDHVLVTTGGVVHDYVITATMSVSFRSAASKAKQTAPVPGQPGVRATKPMITLSTCATPEDHAAGNYWADELGNPEHRIDKIGVLTATRPAG
jgi:sortase A